MTETLLHASCVALERADRTWRAVLITGASGTGKSSLALELISRGGWLVADDRTLVCRADDRLIAACPPAIAGFIEARGIGLIHAAAINRVQLALVVDLDGAEQDRLPPPRSLGLLGLDLPRILCGQTAGRAPTAHAAAIHLLLRGSGAPEPS